METFTSICPQAAQVAEISLAYQPKVKISQCPKIHSSTDVYRLLLERWNREKLEFVEEFKVLVLNRANRVLGELLLASGSTVGVIVDVKLVLYTVIKSNACSFIIAHNHPSGNLKPSEQDRRLTSKIKAAAELMDLSLLDHIIVTAEGYYSFADEGLL
jgi:DNA repair protein RadC